jgi:hypothetical protein
MARKRASMREGPLAELFRATEAAQRGQTEPDTAASAVEPEPVVPDSPAETAATESQLPLGAASRR